VKDGSFSFIVQWWRDTQQGITRLKVVDVDTTEEILLGNSSFLLHFWTEGMTVRRCLIRHLPSGREAYLQSSSGLYDFIKTCLFLTQGASPERGSYMTKKILIVLTEWGYWGEELLGPLETFDAAGYEVTFATPIGKRPHALPASMDPNSIDPPLGRSVTSPEVARKVRELDESNRLNNPINLSEWLPERPYWSAPSFLRDMEAYYRALEGVQKDLEQYDTMLIVGGSGALVDLANNQRVHDLVLSFYHMGKPVAAECYGVTCLAFARDLEDRQSIIKGKHVTGHCKEYDYKDGTGFLGTDFKMGPPPYPLEYVLRDATGPKGRYIGNFGKETSVIVDYPFITGRSTPDSYLTGEKVVEVLEQGLKRYGW
jgi:putative intracellular protease/amidase